MANSDKNILITPNINQSGLPDASFTGFGATTLSIKVPDDTTAKVNFDNGTTTVFSIDASDADRSQFVVSDNFGTPSLEVNNDSINLGSQNGKVIIKGNGIKLPSFKTGSFPSNPKEGTMIYDESSQFARCFDGSKWLCISEKRSGLDPGAAAMSAFQLKYDYPNFTNGAYWIMINNQPVLLYCDLTEMDGGGWTLIGKSRGTWHNPNYFLKDFINLGQMSTNSPMISNNDQASIDARDFCVNRATEICFSNHTLSRWVRAPMHTGRTVRTIFNVQAGQSTINTDATNNSQTVTAQAWNGGTTTSFVNTYMVMALSGHGGSFPAWTLNTAGNTNVSEYAMACAVATTTHNGFTAGATHNGQDAPYDQTNDNNWPNSSYNSGGAYMLIWAR